MIGLEILFSYTFIERLCVLSSVPAGMLILFENIRYTPLTCFMHHHDSHFLANEGPFTFRLHSRTVLQ